MSLILSDETIVHCIMTCVSHNIQSDLHALFDTASERARIVLYKHTVKTCDVLLLTTILKHKALPKSQLRSVSTAELFGWVQTFSADLLKLFAETIIETDAISDLDFMACAVRTYATCDKTDQFISLANAFKGDQYNMWAHAIYKASKFEKSLARLETAAGMHHTDTFVAHVAARHNDIEFLRMILDHPRFNPNETATGTLYMSYLELSKEFLAHKKLNHEFFAQQVRSWNPGLVKIVQGSPKHKCFGPHKAPAKKRAESPPKATEGDASVQPSTPLP